MRRILLSCGMDILQIDDLRETNIRMTDMITPGTKYYSSVIFKYLYETLMERRESRIYKDHGYFLGNIYKLKGKLDVAPLFTGGIRLGKESDEYAANREMFEESGLYCEKFFRKPFKTTSENRVNWTFYRGFFNSVRVDKRKADHISKDDSKTDKVGVLVYGEYKQIKDICQGDIFTKEMNVALRVRNSKEHIVDVCIIRVSEIRDHLYRYRHKYYELSRGRTFNTTRGDGESKNWRSRSTSLGKSVQKSRRKSVRKSKSRRKKSVRKSKSRRKKSVRKSKSRRKSVRKSKSRRKKSVRKSKSRGKPVKLSKKNSCRKDNSKFFFNPETKVRLGKFYWKMKIASFWSKYGYYLYAPRTIKLFSKGEKYVFKKPKMLGKGGFGGVFEYKDFEHDMNIVLKIEGGNYSRMLGNRRSEPSEKEISEVLNKNGNKCNTIRTRYIESRGPKYKRDHYYIMEKYSGDTTELLKTLESDYSPKERIKIWLEIVETVRKQMACLAKLGFYYTDLKPPNILYCKNSDGTISINLGDLGAAVPGKDGNGYHHLSPWNPPEYFNDSIRITEENGTVNKKKGTAVLLFMLGILGLIITEDIKKEMFVEMFINDYTDMLYNFYDEKITMDQVKKMYKESLNSYLAKTQLNKKQKALFRKLLALMPLERIEKVDINKPFKW